jgi:xanthine dehydrogenase YagS FAD-binding subunit
MNSFAIAKPKSFDQASGLMTGTTPLPVLKAGGMDVVDHLKEGLIAPDMVVDIKRIGRKAGSDGIAFESGKLTVSATTTLAEVAASKIVLKHAPALAHAADSAATPQVRNVASAAGNLLQRPRCWYYRNAQFNCLKKGGHTCYAVEGINNYHAIFGDGPCHIVHPSNLAPPLLVCDGVVKLVGGKRDTIPLPQLYHTPDRGILSEHNLEDGEVITAIELMPAPNSAFYSIKHKQSFDWPIVMATAALELKGTTIESARVCAGAVAPVPWPLLKVQHALRGVNVDDDAALRTACAKASDGARPMSDNAYKLKLLPVAVRRAILKAAGRKVEV